MADDEQWQRLVTVMGSPAWALDPALSTEAGRRDRHDEIDLYLAEWSSARTATEAAELCRKAGISAAPALDEAALFADPHLEARGWFRPNGCEDVETILFPGHQWRWDGAPMRWDALNMMGRDNDYVYRTLLSKSDSDMEALASEHHLALGYLDAEGNLL